MFRLALRARSAARSANLASDGWHHRCGGVLTHTLTSSVRSLAGRVSVAIVGSGPSGCYTAKFLQAGAEKVGMSANIDVLDRLPTPYGLVRYGVAPDHPEVKNVQKDFDNLFEKGGNRFLGNVNVGEDVSVQELRELYDVVVLSYGCQSDRKLGVPGENLEGVLSAREFVAWYNGHPNYDHTGEKVARALGGLEDGVRDASVVVLGNGNVALDCARVLAKATPGLHDTDAAARALPVLGDGVASISIVGRRGHVQGAFTIKELRELVKLEEEGHATSFVVREDELDMGTTAASLEELNGPHGRPKKRINKLLREAASKAPNTTLPKCIRLRFLLNPIRFEASDRDSTSLGAVVCERNRLEGEPGEQRAKGTGEFETIPAQLALVSIGYKGLPLRGTEEWFDDERGVIRNDHGLVEGKTARLGGLYATGWLKRGPSGIIGTNIMDAKETVATILTDLVVSEPSRNSHGPDLSSMLRDRNVKVVDWEGYRRIEKEESARRRSENQPREKIVSLEDQLAAAFSEAT